MIDLSLGTVFTEREGVRITGLVVLPFGHAEKAYGSRAQAEAMFEARVAAEVVVWVPESLTASIPESLAGSPRSEPP